VKRYLPSIKRYSWIILACLVLMALAGYFVSNLIPSTYSVNSILLVEPGAPGTTLPGVAARGTPLDEANYYSGEIVSRTVMIYVYETALELNTYHFKPEDLLLDIVPAPSTTAPTITITATVTNPNGAIAMANAVAIGFSKYISEQAQAELALEKSNLQTQVNNQMAEKNQDQATMQAVGNTRDIRYIIANKDLGLVNQRINALEQQLDLRNGQARECEDQQERHHQRHPDEQRHPLEAHSGRAADDDCDDQVDRRADRPDSQHEERDKPIVDPL